MSHFFRLILITFILSSCAKKSDSEQASGNLRVQVGVQKSPTAYDLQTVELQGITKLSEVAGQFAQFFFSPGSTSTGLTGSAPHAYFVHSGNLFVPSDVISLQMATIYYHLQNLANFDQEAGAGEVNKWPRSVGLETQVIDETGTAQKNNAFYNGQTDSMMFVPYDKTDMPIAINAGIIAHEHFHSLFFKIVIRPASANKNIGMGNASIHSEETISTGGGVEFHAVQASALSDKEKAQAFNETFLRGINEGLADFWGWVYTDDPEFMRWSLPQFQGERTLTLSESKTGSYETKAQIEDKVENFFQQKAALINYAYEVGTPYARFMKQLSVFQADAKGISLVDSKKLMAQLVVTYIRDLAVRVQNLKDTETIDPAGLFDFAAKNNLIKMDQKSCEFMIKYFNLNQADRGKLQTCQSKGEKDSKSFVIVKP